MRALKFELPVRITLLYLVFGGLWIILSDQFLFLFIFHDPRETAYQTFKGWLFILASGALLYTLLLMDLAGRRRAEAALRQSEAQFTGIFHSAMDAIITTDAEQRIVIFNPAAEAILRCPRVEALGQPLERFIPERFRVRHREYMREFAEMGKTNRSMGDLGTLYALRNDGQEFPIEASISKTDIGGQHLFTVILRDITERKQAEGALQIANARFLRMVDANIVGIVVTDASGKTVLANDYYLDILKLTRQDFIEGKVDWRKFTPPEWLPADEKAIEQLRERGVCEPYEKEYERADGTRAAVYIADAMLPGPGEQILAFVLDITERKQAEEKLRRHINYLTGLQAVDQAIASSFEVGLSLNILTTRALPLLKVDAAAVLLLDPVTNSLEYAAGQGFSKDLLHMGSLRLNESYAGRAVLERRMVHIQDLAKEPQDVSRYGFLKEEQIASYYGVPLIVKGKVVGVMEVFHRSPGERDQEWFNFLDSMARQAAIAIDNARLWEQVQQHARELELRVAERTAALNRTNAELEHANRAKDEFLANMSHELRTPLNSILGLTESLLEQRRDPLTGYQQKSLEIISSSGHHLLELINDVLDLSKIEAGKFDHHPQIVDVDSLCRSSLAFIKNQAAKKSITVKYHNEDSLPNISADPRRLKQILVNLLTNAVKFTPERGEVTLHVQTAAEQGRVRFSIIDNGIGIAPEDLRRLFQPFVQVDSKLNRQFEGTGLGLALVQRLTDLHGGSVEVESQMGAGSRFTINLPWQPNGQSPENTAASLAWGTSLLMTAPGAQGTVLVAEDNLANNLIISEYLESHGYKTVKAYDGLEAIEKAESNHLDIILMDIQMPVVDGLEAIHRLRANPGFSNVPIIAVTALTMPGDRERCLEAGANEYMSKPVSLTMLVDTLKKLVDQHR